MSVRARRVATVVAALLAAGWALRELALQVGSLGPGALHAALAGLPLAGLLACLALTALSFVGLAVIERLAVRVAGTTVPPARAMAVGATAHALCNTLGFHAVLAPAFRLALYRRDGGDGWAIARVLAVVGGALVAGSAIAALFAAAAAWGGGAGLAGALVLVLAMPTLLRHLPRRLARRMPASLAAVAPRIALFAVLEAGCAMAALYVLMPDVVRASPAHFVLAFTGSALLGIVSHAPGGIGVFEAGMLAALPGDRAHLLTALLVLRLVYNLLPASVAGLALAGRLRRRGFSSTVDTRGSRVAAPGTGAPATMHRWAGVPAAGSRH